MELNTIFSSLWADYTTQNPSAGKIHELFSSKGEKVVNDHIAFRTLNDNRININVLAKPFIENGYIPKGEYVFKDKHLFARHYELPGHSKAPRVFISQLILEDFSGFLQKTLQDALTNVNPVVFHNTGLILSGSLFDPISYQDYNQLRMESEYAAWFYVFGFRANHFTVSVNELKTYNTLIKVNQLLKENGFMLNSSGGEIKGSEKELLQQSSTMADIVSIRFTEGVYEIPCCYYEFAQRHPTQNGELFGGFVAQSADKIFESTDYYKNEK